MVRAAAGAVEQEHSLSAAFCNRHLFTNRNYIAMLGPH